jgi:hypothetical protein
MHLRVSASNPRSELQKNLLNCAELYHIAEPNETTESARRIPRRNKYQRLYFSHQAITLNAKECAG